MKKAFITIFMAFVAIAGFAQTTFNVRVGGGFYQVSEDLYYSGYYGHSYYENETESRGGMALVFEVNVPLGRRINNFIFSPSLSILSDFTNDVNFNVPLHFGYKFPMGDGSLFIPKIGPMVGFSAGGFGTDAVIYGPSAELAFEIKHFVVAVNTYVGIDNDSKIGVFGSVGYKF